MTPERDEMKQRAAAKLAAMRERGRQLRNRVIAAAAIGFAVLWATIFIQMVSGHDPALGPTTAALRSPGGSGDAALEVRSSDEHEGDEDGWASPAQAALTSVEEALAGPVEESQELEPATTGQS